LLLKTSLVLKDEKSSKYYNIYLTKKNSLYLVYCDHGKIGSAPIPCVRNSFRTKKEAVSFFDKQKFIKVKKGYTEVFNEDQISFLDDDWFTVPEMKKQKRTNKSKSFQIDFLEPLSDQLVLPSF
jgi:predicted DNA-binding WGR domain protein